MKRDMKNKKTFFEDPKYLKDFMKKRMIILELIAMIIIIALQRSSSKASVVLYDSYCNNPKIILKDPDSKYDWYYTAQKEKVSPNFVLDYFQDPKENGVTLTVIIEAMPLIATFSKWEDVCTPYDSVQPDMTACDYEGEYKPGFHHAYWTRACVQQPSEETYRSIDTDSISIWLEPTIGTNDLLGPGPYIKNSKKPVLRSLYPDQWALVVVRPGERKIIEKPSFRNSEEIKKFLKENKDFIVLDTSSTWYSLASRLPIKWSPASKNIALSLFDVGSICRADLVELGGREVCSHSWVEKISGYGANQMTIGMDRIPLDVPGEWYVGVSFNLLPAKFDGGKGVEAVNRDNLAVFSTVNDEKRFSFESYIIRSAPCNPDEPNNCWEEKKPGG